MATTAATNLPPSVSVNQAQQDKLAKERELRRKKEAKARRILIAIIVVAVVLLIFIVIVAVIVSYLRQDVAVASMSFDVGNPVVWQVSSVCDPFNITQGKYRLNFFSGDTAFAHTILITNEATNETLINMVVPQQSAATLLTYSYLLPEPGSYRVSNYSNNAMLGAFTFTYPNPCSVAYIQAKS